MKSKIFIWMCILSESVWSAPKLTFHACFNGKTDATFAAGNPKAINANGLDYVTGMSEQAVRLTSSAHSALNYEMAKNVDPVQGAVTFWMKTDWGKTDSQKRTFFTFLLPNQMPRLGSGQITFCKSNHVDFQVAAAASNEVVTAQLSMPLPTDAWHFYTVCWDASGTKFYIDGHRFRMRGEGANAEGACTVSPGLLELFSLGSDNGAQVGDCAIDEFSLFSEPLSEEQIFRLAVRQRPLEIRTLHTHLIEGEKAPVTVTVVNHSDHPQPVSWSLEGTNHYAGRLSQPLAPQTVATVEIPTTALALGKHTLTVRGESGLPATEDFFVILRKNPEVAKLPNLWLELLDTQTLDHLPAPDRFLTANGKPTFHDFHGVRYLETATNENSRYVIRFALPNEGHLFCFDCEFPDDKPRSGEIVIQPCQQGTDAFELQTGYLTGGDMWPSGRYVNWRCFYWAREGKENRDVAVILTCRRAGQPAAFSKIRLYRVVGGLPVEPIVKTPGIRQREVGIYYSDPDFMHDFGSPGADAASFAVTVDRLTASMRYSGQQLLALPFSGGQGIFGEEDFTRVHTLHAADAVLTRCDADGLGYEMILSAPCVPSQRNLLHPATQRIFSNEFARAMEVGCSHPSFRGINLQLTPESSFTLGSLDRGYDDETLEAFVRETGLPVPFDRKDPLRAKKAAAWLLANARAQWIDWRCRQVAAFFLPFAKRLAAVRSDARLVFTLFTDPMAIHPDANVPDYLDRLNREFGFDVRLYASCRNVIFAQTLYPVDDRHPDFYSRKWTPGQCEYAQARYFRASSYATLEAAASPRVHLNDRAWESALGTSPDALSSPWFRELPWRASTLTQVGNYCMRPYLQPFKFVDVQSFTKGGFLIGTHGMEPWLTPFARTFSALPAVPFKTVNEFCAGDVVVRQAECGGYTWFYAANTGVNTMRCEINLGGGFFDFTKPEVVDLLTGSEPIELSGHKLPLTVAPFSFRAFRQKIKK